MLSASVLASRARAVRAAGVPPRVATLLPPIRAAAAFAPGCTPLLHAVSGVSAASAPPSVAATACQRRFQSSGATGGNRAAALAAALRQIESTFGKGSIMTLGSRSGARMGPGEVISTGSLTLDEALGIGGLPRGRVVEIYGAESSGKTTVALQVVAEAQKMGLNCCFVDAEHALDPTYAKAIGVNLDALCLTQPDTGEQALEITDVLVRSGAMDVIVIDSVAALVPKAEIEGEMGDHHMALQARLMSQALRKLTANLSKSKTLIIFINQIRSKVGVMFGNPEVTTGGNALKFYASIRMEIRRGAQIKRGDDVVGNETKIKVAKNKLAPPFRVAEFEMTYGHGISRSGEVVDLGTTYGVFKKSGAWYAVMDPTIVAAINSALTSPAPRAGVPAAAAAVNGGAAHDLTAALAMVQSGAAAASAAKPKKGGKKGAASTAMPASVPAPAAGAPEPAAPSTPADAGGMEESTTAAAFAAAARIEPGQNFMQGKEKLKAFLEAHPRVLQAATDVLRQRMRDGPPDASKAGAAVGSADAHGVDMMSAVGGNLAFGSLGGAAAATSLSMGADAGSTATAADDDFVPEEDM